jgi:hypothetical protein
MERFDRRAALAVFAAVAAAPLLGWEQAAAAAPAPTMWRDPGCGCCTGWAKKVEAALGVRFKVVDSPDMTAVKNARGVPADLRSCHTALIGGYVVEGHVPAEDIKRLLATRPAGAGGLATPGMPTGSPGMEMGAHREPYRVFAFDRSGRRSVFASHG